MDQRIRLQQRVAGVDSLGQPSTTWQDVATLWAQAQPLRGREFWAAGQMQSEASVRFRVRWRSGVTTAMRVLWRDQAHDIVAVVDVDGGHHTLELLAAAGVGDGR
jgi:SPP1 family predicted phage head-tail adaptor